ncbi:MAG: hypothetical protein HOQ43_14000, partial [Glycomyces artemisiae]|nr:hypothetical protein [Glycomyces artemisiae]
EPEEDLDFAEYEQQLTETYNEGARLEVELDAAENRIVQACMERQGFTVHDPWELREPEAAERETFMDAPPYDLYLPTVEDARRRGFWQWTFLDGAAEVEDGDALLAEWDEAQGDMGWAEIDFTEEDPQEAFHALPDDEQFAWYTAYAGEPWAEWMHGDLVGIAPDEIEGEWDGPETGGCKLEMIEAVYGGLDEGEDEHSVRPMRPDGDWTRMKERYASETAGAEGDLLDCLADRGRDGWEFYDGQLLVHDYLVAAGEGEYALNSYPDAGTRWPDPPADLPDADDAQGWLDYERDLATDFAECGDESGYREAAVHGWQQAQLRYYLDNEDAVYGWQEEIRDLIARAQDAIGD